MKLGPFAHAPYTEKNLLSGLLLSLSKINTSSYNVSGSFSVGARDKDATSFTAKFPKNTELHKQYQRDATRARDMSAIFNRLQMQLYQTKAYPKSFNQILTNSRDPRIS